MKVVDGTVRLVVQVKPRSSKEGVARAADGTLVVRVRAPPVDGEANARLVEVLAAALGVRKGDVSVVRGASARHKELAVLGLDPERARALVEALPGA
ncbi:MAG: DUF167 domain-containing protein [Deltaproteobacteria bacterium]|nr:DUF167 domain-containing protein [Deltaproteobacteria bacterium]